MVEIEKVKASVPDHLRQYIVDQYETHYTAEDQAVWRYCLRQLKHYLSTHAHDCYAEGLEKTGITVNEIPSIDDMCLRLKAFGWSAVPVSGFIPPAAFMELQSLSILPIATGMRSVNTILYTPAPDIVHEAAGHAPILVDESFAAYLKSYASIAKKALIAKHDLDLYDAIRSLSDLKEQSSSTTKEIKNAEAHLSNLSANTPFLSEAALLGRMNWWTAEYGLFGDINNPLIYGAGLLSSIGEAKGCLKSDVRKIPLSVDCVEYGYDITEPQPQLFVAESFASLTKILDELADTLAFRRGGTYGLEKAIECETVNTAELNSGLQVSGLFSNIIKNSSGETIYFKTTGPTQLGFNGYELSGHGKAYHKDGFSSPLGPLEGGTQLSSLSLADLEAMGCQPGKTVSLKFESGVEVTGLFVSVTTQPEAIAAAPIILSFRSCTVRYKDETLFDPSWGDFDMAVGEMVRSVFAGPADRKAFGISQNFASRKVPAKNQSPRMERLSQLYLALRTMRKEQNIVVAQLQFLADELTRDFPEQWLLRLEILELLARGWATDAPLESKLRLELEKIKTEHPENTQVIEDGLAIARLIF